MTQENAGLRETLLKHGLELEGHFNQSLTWEIPVRLHLAVNAVDVELGSYSYVAPYTELHHVSIGRYCSIGPHCRLFGAAHPTRWLSSHPFTHQSIFKHFLDYEPALQFEGYGQATRIGHDVWVGVNAIILPGVKIGHGAIIGAGAVVPRDVPDYAVVVGNPGRIVKYRFDERLIERLLRVQWWQFDLPRHVADKPDLPLDRPEAMLDYLEEHAQSLPRLSGVRKQLLSKPEGLVIRTIAPEVAGKAA
jgi:acetyltransferase-like isoleucine patch superfamily enzyme